MTVERNRITCDGNHGEPVVLVVPDVPPRFVTPAKIRAYARQFGWTMRLGEDICPSCSS